MQEYTRALSSAGGEKVVGGEVLLVVGDRRVVI